MSHEYTDDGPAVSRGRPTDKNFVSPTPAPLATRPAEPAAPPTWLQTAKVVDVAAVWGAQEAAQERTSAVDRAKGLQLRLWPFLALYGLAGAVVGLGVWLAAASVPLAALAAVLVFAALGVGTYLKLNGQDYAHSGAGVERHRIDTAAYLAERHMDHEQELRRMALESYLRHLDGRNEE